MLRFKDTNFFINQTYKIQKFVLLLFVVAASAFVAQKRVISPELEQLTGSELVDYVNQHQTLWKAKLSSAFNTLTMEERKRKMGVKSIEVPAEYRMKEVTHREIPDDQIPDTFDAQTQWPNCQLISHIRDQSACGSCWAMSSAEVMSDRLCIFSNGQIQVQISAVDILSCCGLICNENCIGGYPIEAFKNWISKGYVTGGDYNSGEGCKPYPWAECEHHYHNETHYKNCPLIPTHLEPKCVHECEAGYSKSYNEDLYFGQSAYAVSKQVADIQKELMTNGPIVLAYNIYEDFEHYVGGIYVHQGGRLMGGHAVKLVGWGTENGTPFWRIANSWNTDWGENGYFRILRGVDECGIEKVVLLCLVAACSALVLPQHRKISPELQKLTGLDLVDYINNNQKLWTAKLSAKFAHMTEAGKKRLINGVKMIEVPPTDREINEMTHPEISDDTIPDTFDAIQQWANCPSIAHIRDQSACGSCWAISGAEAMSDRICIATNGATQVSISADDIMACCGFMCGDGCNGGYPIEAWRTWVSRGYVTGGDYGSNQGCKPYPFAQCEHHTNGTHYKPCPSDIYPTDKCSTQCEDGYPKSYNDDKWFGKSAYAVSKKVAEIQKELMTNGPIELAYSVYEDFEHYTGGIYTHTAGSYLGGHAVKLVGWGTENGTPFWRIANSWNTDWGENGYFRIIRGVNECGIESGAVAGLPKV